MAETGKDTNREFKTRSGAEDTFKQEFLKVKDELKLLRKKSEAAKRLLEVTRAAESFLTDVTSNIAREEKDDQKQPEATILHQARQFERTVDPDSVNRRPQMIREIYNRLIGTKTSENSVSETQRQAVNTHYREQFTGSLDSSLPQLKHLLTWFFPKENPEMLKGQENQLLTFIADHLRLERGGAGRLKATGGISFASEPEDSQSTENIFQVRNELQTQVLRKNFIGVLLHYLISHSPNCQEIAQDLQLSGESDQVSKPQLLQVVAQYEARLAALRQSKNIRRAEFRLWLTERAAENPRIAGTPEDMEEINAIIKAQEATNRVGGVIVLGPPGTGKTEKLIEANRLSGFETRVISMHRHSDFAQLLGSAPVFLEGLDQSASAMQRISALEKFLAKPEAEVKAVLKQQPDIVEKLLAFTPQTKFKLGDLESDQLFEPETFEVFYQELHRIVNTDLINLFLDTGTQNKDEVWVNGEIQRAIANGQMPLLDEGDKAPPSAFDGISALLSKRRGESVKLGGQEFQLPHWCHIDITVNSSLLPEHIRDRFTELKMDYPGPEDLLRKVGLWLTDEQGEIKVDPDTEWQVAIFFTYVVPRIHQQYVDSQAEYEKKVRLDAKTQPKMRPFSMRGMSTFCRRVAKGESVDLVIEDELLKPGKIADEKSNEYEMLLGLIRQFNQLTSGLHFVNEETTNAIGVKRMIESPIYSAVTAREHPSTIAQKREITNVASANLGIVTETVGNSSKESYRLPSGVTISQRLNIKNELEVSYSYQVADRTKTFLTVRYPKISNIGEILDADLFGEHIIIQGPKDTMILRPLTDKLTGGENKIELISSDVKQSLDGKTRITLEDRKPVLYHETTVPNLTERLTFTFNGQPVSVREYDLSEDGTALVLKTLDNRVFICYAARELAQTDEGEGTVELGKWEALDLSPYSEWQFTGNVLWSPQSSQALVIS